MDITSALPASLRTGTTLIEVDGRPTAWLMPDGRVFPYVAGGDEGEEPTGEGDDKGGEDDNVDNKDTVSMSQADFDALISKKIGQARKGWDKEILDAAETAALDEAGKARKERDDAQAAADQKSAGADQKLVTAEAKVVALDLQVNPKRVDALVRLAGLQAADLVEGGQVDTAEVKRALEKVLADYPEFKGATSAGASSTDHNSNSGGSKKRSWTRAEIAAMTPAEFAEHEEQIMAAMKAGAITD